MIDRAAWNEILASDPEAMPTQSPEFVSAICGDGRWVDATRAYADGSGRRIVLPMVRRAGSIAIEASPPPRWGFGGLLAEGGVRAADVEIAVRDLAARRILRQSVRPNPVQGDRWKDTRRGLLLPRRAHVADLERGEAGLWSDFSKTARRNVRKAEKAGVEVECDSTGRLLPAFFRLHDLSRVRWASQQHEPVRMSQWRTRRHDPPEKWERIARALGDSCRVWIAWYRGEPAAGMIVLHGVSAHDTRGAIDKELAEQTQANYLLQWSAMRGACAEGIRWYHLGESGNSARLSYFKERCGARPFDYAELRFERLPITKLDDAARRTVKRLTRFRDAEPEP